MTNAYPLYDPSLEHESCGVGAVVDLKNDASHRTVSDALSIVERLAHRAGSDALGTTGDGVGILTQLPHELFAKWAVENDVTLGKPGEYAVGMFFFPQDEIASRNTALIFEDLLVSEGFELLGWRDVPCHTELLGAGARRTQPCIRQCFVARPKSVKNVEEFDRKLYVLRRLFERQQTDTYVCSLSSRTIVYKGMMLVTQLRTFYDDLHDETYQSRIAMVHSRFSTNTTPSWAKAHPQRMLLHNGEINTIRGNFDRMLAREETMKSDVWGKDLGRVYPVAVQDGSDSQMLDNALEFLNRSGMPLPLAAMVLVPEPWQGKGEETPWRDLYRYYATMMEPWDGPAAILYSDGDCVCASLDRNGLRPLRCAMTDEGRLILSSETGALYEETPHIVRRWRLHSGDLLMADLASGELLEGDVLKEKFAAEHPYSEWMQNLIHLEDIPAVVPPASPMTADKRMQLCKAFGYRYEDIAEMVVPMAKNGTEPIVSMGADEPMAVLSKVHPSMFDYFKQRFAQVTNPPIDAIREKMKTDRSIYIGDDGNLLEPSAENSTVIELSHPILTAEELSRLRSIQHPAFKVRTLSLLYPKDGNLHDALHELFQACSKAHAEGANIIILSDRGMDSLQLAIPSLLAVSGLEQYLIRTKLRTAVSVVLESGEPRDVHQMAMLIGYGARAICPYLAHECIAAECEKGRIEKTAEQAISDYNEALSFGVLKIASKIGVSTLQAYQSAQLFEAIGLDGGFVDAYFTNTHHVLDGAGLSRIEMDSRWHHAQAFEGVEPTLDSVGVHKLRSGKGAEEHLYKPEVIHMLQQAVWTDDRAKFDAYTSLVTDDGPRTIRSLLDFNYDACVPVPLEEVESVASIVKRFKTGAMSYGSISQEAHECMARAMNHLGGKSNSGEGGELPERFGTELNSAIKQVASGRFGVTREYLLSAKEIQIKMAQGAKPGEGGHLPGHKVSEEIARTRCSTPGISLISPPPHHDIYSIEDLAQLIYDLQCANEEAKVTVKLVSSGGVGTIASGVAKAGAGGILISGGEGGTGAAPMSSVHHAGLPWEIGLAEAHQVLCRNGLRQSVTLETDGKLMSGHDVAVAMLLGAEEFGFATAPLITMGCRMMRVCQTGNCPFGIATQDPEFRKRFIGKPEYVERFMLFIAEQLREIMAKLGARTVSELVGRSDLLVAKENATVDLSVITEFSNNAHWRAGSKLDLHHAERSDREVPSEELELHTADRCFGTLLPGDCDVKVTGGVGQSFGAFLRDGQKITLHGEANDYLGKGLSGGTLAICPPEESQWAEDDVLIGNVALVGATSGYAFIAGQAGERFCVRNSGATAVVEGIGDHGLEYMTGGRAVVLGTVGDNFAAGMSGGVAYVYDAEDELVGRLNKAGVEVEALSEGMLKELKSLLEMHVDATGSPKAKDILKHFKTEGEQFKAVLSPEYKRIMEGEWA